MRSEGREEDRTPAEGRAASRIPEAQQAETRRVTQVRTLAAHARGGGVPKPHASAPPSTTMVVPVT